MRHATDETSRVWVVLDLEPKKRGSLEQGLVALAARLQELHVAATFVFSNPPTESWFQDALDSHGVTTRILSFRKPVDAAFTFAQWLHTAPPTLVHFHFVRAHSPLVWMARLSGARVLVHDHMALGEAIPGYRKHSDRKKSILRPLKRFRGATLLRCVDARIAVSRFVAASVVDAEFYPLERIEVVPNGVDVGRFAAADPMALRWELGLGSRSMVACVSRVSHEKGVHILIQAFSTLPGDVVLVIAGDGPNTDYCKRLVAALGLADRVYFLGLRNDVENIYAAADLIAMPSLCDEAFGLSAVEAMAAGKPLIATNAGAMPEILADGECGELVPRNDETALATAISSLLANPARAKSLGEAARKRALENYPIEKWVDGVIGAYSRLVPAIRPSSTVFSFQGGSAETENAPATPRNETATPPAHDAVG